jgi:RNA polymerase sigma-70 factor (ECF subfamily)
MTRRRPPADVRAQLEACLDRHDYPGGTRLLSEALGRDLLAFLRRYFAQRSDADDVAQEVWMAVLAGLPRFRREASPKTWILRIAMNKVRDVWRKRQATEPLTTSLLSHIEKQQHNDQPRRPQPDAAHSLHARQQRVAAALERLTPEQREVAALVIQGGLLSAEASELLDMPEGTVRWIKKQVIDALLDAVDADA